MKRPIKELNLNLTKKR